MTIFSGKNMKEYIQESEFGPGIASANLLIPEGFSLPLTSALKLNFPIRYDDYILFGKYNLYFAAFEANTANLVSNIANASFSIEKQSGKWTNYPYRPGNTCLAMDGDVLWCGSKGGACSINTKNDETKYITNADGLMSNYIMDITIDKTGRTWFATKDDGISVFDGNKWIQYNHTTTKIQNDNISSISVDKIGRIWTGTQGGGVYSFNGKEFINFDNSLVRSVGVIAPAPDGKIWFGTGKSSSKGAGVWVYDGENWKQYKKSNSGIADDIINAIAHDIDGKVWIGTQEHGISVFDGENWTTISVSENGLAISTIGSIAIDSIGRKWIAASGVGVQVYDNNSWTTYTPENSGLASARVSDILIDSKDRCWFSTDKGVSMFDGSEWKNYTTTNNPFKGPNIKKITIDTNGNKWIYNAIYQGESNLFIFDEVNWTEITPDEAGLSTWNNINVIFPDKGGRVWLGTMDTGLSVFDSQNWKTYNASIPGCEFTANYVVSITQDRSGKIWVGTYGDGLFTYDGENWQKIDISTGDQNIIYYFENLNFDSTGNLWFSSNIGLCIYNGVNLVYYNKDNSGFSYEFIDNIAIDSKDRIWLIGKNVDSFEYYAIVIFDGNNWITYNSANSPLPIREINDITISPDDKVYIGTGTSYGLFVFDGIDWTVYNSYNSGLLDNYVTSIAIDNDGKKWIGTGAGISVLDDSE
jgi:ligand-binding sensor domain-containing protein